MRTHSSISLNLREQEYSFILNTAEQCASNGGAQISKEAVLRTLIRLLQHLEVDVSGIETEEQLLNRLQDVCNAL